MVDKERCEMRSSRDMCDLTPRRWPLAAALALLVPVGALRAQESPASTPAPTPVEQAAPAMAAVPAEAPTAATAQRAVSTLPNPEIPPSAVPVSGDAIRLSLDDAITTALQRNLGLL